MLLSALQNRPVLSVQSTLPQPHTSEFSLNPSANSQEEDVRQVLFAAMQVIPVSAEHVALPQAHLSDVL